LRRDTPTLARPFEKPPPRNAPRYPSIAAAPPYSVFQLERVDAFSRCGEQIIPAFAPSPT
jgi:hypothetical protein